MPSLSNAVYTILASLATVGLLLQPQALAQTCTSLTAQYPASFAEGYSAKLLINGLKYPRDMKFDTLGNLLVVEQGGAGVRQIKLTDDGTNVCVASSKQIIDDASVSSKYPSLMPWSCVKALISSFTYF